MRGPGHVERREEVLLEDGLEVGRIHVVDRPRPRAADVRDDDVEPAEGGHGAVDNRRRTLGRRDVCDHTPGTTRPAGAADRLVQRLRPSRAEEDIRALPDEPCRDAAADPPARAGDHGDLPGEPEIHGG